MRRMVAQAHVQNPRPVEILGIAPCLSIDETVVLTGIGRTTIYEEIKAGKLKLRKCRGCSVLVRAEIDEWLQNLPLKSVKISDGG